VIPQSFIQELLGRVDIVDVVGRHVTLRKGGANWMGLCPFHGEKSPSFSVSPTKQFYHCFGCGAHGSAIGFLMERLGLSYPDAIRDLAREVGLEVPDERPGREEDRRRDPDLLDTLAAAQKFYKLRLKDHPHAIDYLRHRGMSGETAAAFGIGYAPDGWRSLEAAVPDYSAKALVESGLVIESEVDGGDEGARKKRYDRFRDRIMFPIRNPRGLVIGFGGRVLGRGEPKYLNSPETPVFSKGRELYGLHEGRDTIRREGCVIVVEGYMDVVMLAQHGVRNAVATLGTATTSDHVRKLLRLADRVVFAFDGDAAGRRAAWRALEVCLPHADDSKRIDFLFLPPEHDPDSFIRERGADGWRHHLSGAQSLSEFMLRELGGRVDLGTPEGRARLQAMAKPLLLAMPPIALRLQLVQSVAAQAGVRAEDLLHYLGPVPPAAPGMARDRFDGDPGPLAGDGNRPVAEGREGGHGGWRDRWRDRNGAWRDGPGGGGRSGWRGERGPGERWGPAPFFRPMPVTLPDLPRRARLLLALHPGLAREAWSTEFVPQAVTDWIARLAALPDGADFAQLVASLEQIEPDLAAALKAEAARDRGLLAGLETEQARREFEGALIRMKGLGLKEEVDRLAAQGLVDDAQRTRYAELQALRKALTSPDGS
jgi:DNA primase